MPKIKSITVIKDFPFMREFLEVGDKNSLTDFCEYTPLSLERSEQFFQQYPEYFQIEYEIGLIWKIEFTSEEK